MLAWLFFVSLLVCLFVCLSRHLEEGCFRNFGFVLIVVEDGAGIFFCQTTVAATAAELYSGRTVDLIDWAVFHFGMVFIAVLWGMLPPLQCQRNKRVDLRSFLIF